jgi:hypothetical protein
MVLGGVRTLRRPLMRISRIIDLNLIDKPGCCKPGSAVHDRDAQSHGREFLVPGKTWFRRPLAAISV